MKAIMGAVLVVWLVGCASSAFIVQPVEEEPSFLVGLANAPDGSSNVEIRHDHPVKWTTADLRAILKRLTIQEGSGLLDSSKPQQAVFSLEDLTYLIPALQHTFSIARPSDWIVFAVWGASKPSEALEVTSGGLFLQDQQLHILLANHRERVSSEEDGIHAIHKNPFRVLREVNRSLMFYPTSYIMESQNAWLTGGFDSPVSELVLDYQALLAAERPDNLTKTEEVLASERPQTNRRPLSSTDVQLGVLQEEISTLKEELSDLRQQIKEQSPDPSQTKAP